MQFSVIGTIGDFIKNTELKQKWDVRKEDPAKTRKDEDPQISAFKQQVSDARRRQEHSTIETKLKTGARLTGTEMEYLRKNEPELYKKAVAIEKERSEYRRELERCRTKEDVMRLKLRCAQTFQIQANDISKNPNIPQDQKMEALEFISMRAMAAVDEYSRFTATEEYERLPDGKQKFSVKI